MRIRRYGNSARLSRRHSWGATPALCYAAAHPNTVGPIALVGCGTFDAASRARMKEILQERKQRLTRDLSVYDRAEPWPEREEYEPLVHRDYDPHPGPMIYASLRPFIRRLEYRELDRCGHSPWLERFARNEFFSVLKTWLLARSSRPR